jgi:hypothetical protein
LSTIPPIGSGVPPASATVNEPRARAASGASSQSALWQVLTDEERAFFDSMATLGPVSYGPAGQSSANAGAPLGQRIDLHG